jgi:hypothetical protein
VALISLSNCDQLFPLDCSSGPVNVYGCLTSASIEATGNILIIGVMKFVLLLSSTRPVSPRAVWMTGTSRTRRVETVRMSMVDGLTVGRKRVVRLVRLGDRVRRINVDEHPQPGLQQRPRERGVPRTAQGSFVDKRWHRSRRRLNRQRVHERRAVVEADANGRLRDVAGARPDEDPQQGVASGYERNRVVVRLHRLRDVRAVDAQIDSASA